MARYGCGGDHPTQWLKGRSGHGSSKWEFSDHKFVLILYSEEVEKFLEDFYSPFLTSIFSSMTFFQKLQDALFFCSLSKI